MLSVKKKQKKKKKKNCTFELEAAPVPTPARAALTTATATNGAQGINNHITQANATASGHVCFTNSVSSIDSVWLSTQLLLEPGYFLPTCSTVYFYFSKSLSNY